MACLCLLVPKREAVCLLPASYPLDTFRNPLSVCSCLRLCFRVSIVWKMNDARWCLARLIFFEVGHLEAVVCFWSRGACSLMCVSRPEEGSWRVDNPSRVTRFAFTVSPRPFVVARFAGWVGDVALPLLIYP